MLLSSVTFFNAEEEVDFYLYTPDMPDGQKIQFNSIESLNNTNFQPHMECRILVDGFQSGYSDSLIRINVKNEYLKRGNYNLIFVDWSKGSKTLNYIVAALVRVPKVGRLIGRFVNFLVENNYTTHDKVSLVGFSLGAHIVGVAGKKMTHKISTIYALDPAGPMFTLVFSKNRLTSTDAEYVEVIHTCGGSLGFLEPLGNVDIYINGGQRQPGCSKSPIICSHMRAPKLMAESLNSKVGFLSYSCEFEVIKKNQCKSSENSLWIKMGEERGKHRKRMSGVYYLATNSKKPYANETL